MGNNLYCCDSVRQRISLFCSGIPNLATSITPNTDLAIWADIPGLDDLTQCSDTNCRQVGAASSLTYSAVALIVTVILSLAALY
jgi:hypothetical protein